MSEFGTRFEAQAMPRLLGRLGDSVTVTLADGSTLTRTAIFNVQQYAIDHTQDAAFEFTDDSTAGLTAAQATRCTKVTLDSVVWTVIDAKQDEDGGHRLLVKAPQLIT